MEKVIYDEKNGLWYELQGDYYIPCLILPEEEQQPIGVRGQRHLRYIKQNRKVLYLNMLTSGKLNEYLKINFWCLRISYLGTRRVLVPLVRLGLYALS